MAITLNQPDEARDALMILRDGDLTLVEEDMEEMQKEKEAEKEPDISVIDLLTSSKLRVSLIICIVMHLSQQFCGIRSVSQDLKILNSNSDQSQALLSKIKINETME